MKSIKKETGDMEVLLSSDSVLAVNPRVTFRWSNKSADADNKTRQAPGVADESVGLPTLKPEERTLLALADGRRSIESLAKLSGMTTPVAVRHLRALYDRGILVTNDKSGGPPDSDDILAPAAIAAAVAQGPADNDHSGAQMPLSAGGAEAEPIGGSGSGPAASSGPVAADRSGPAGGRRGTSNANVTLFWTPANSDSGGVPDGKLDGASDNKADGTFGSTPPAGASGSQRNSSESTVMVVGSPGSGPSAAPKAEAGVIGSAAATVAVPGASAFGRSESLPGREGDRAVPSSQDTPSPSVAVPFRVGSYEVATRIAQGAMGSIYVCRRVGAAGFQRLFTLKVIRQHSTQKEIAAKSFTREAQYGALLNHPNIQTLVDVGDYEQQPFLILDYIEGTSLLELLADDRRPSASVVVTVMLDVLRALQHVHDVSDENGERLGLVHGDVSPHNVLVGIDGVTRLTDFGSARFSKRTDAPDSEPVAAGKPAYMAPEQLRGEAVDARTDLFSAGVTMWTALTGQKLFAADTYDETVVRVMRRKVPPPSEFGAPACLDAVVLRALSRSPEGRYSSADEMARDLQAVANAEHLVAPGRDVGQWVRREYGEALADRKRKIQEAFGVPSGRTDNPSSQTGPAKRPQRPTPKTSAGLERLPAKTVLLEAGEIQAALGAARSEAHRTRPVAQEASRGQWAVVIGSAVIAAFALTAAIIYLVSSLNATPAKTSRTASAPAIVNPGGAGPAGTPPTPPTEVPTSPSPSRPSSP